MSKTIEETIKEQMEQLTPDQQAQTMLMKYSFDVVGNALGWTELDALECCNYEFKKEVEDGKSLEQSLSENTFKALKVINMELMKLKKKEAKRISIPKGLII